jgi:hypothetical protein
MTNPVAVLALLCAVSSAASAGQWRTGPGTPSVSWVQDESKAVEDRSGLIADARAASGIGAPAGEVQYVSFRDEYPFGEKPGPRPAVLVRFNDVTIQKAGTDERATTDVITILDDQQRTLLCACVDLRASWVLPWDGKAEDAEAHAAELGWFVYPRGTAVFRHSVPEVLGAAWAAWRAHPYVAGQIVLRPRQMAYRQVDEKTGVMYESPTRKARWIVEIRGIVSEQRGEFYCSGRICVFDDDRDNLLIRSRSSPLR